MNAVAASALTRRFGDLTAVDRSLFEVAPGEIFGLVGPDGAGKTTTMRLLTAIMDPTSGDAWVDGNHVARDADAVKNIIGYMSQRFGLYPDLTVMENIDFYADIYGVPRAGRVADDRPPARLQQPRRPSSKRLAGNLSGGMKQKLGLACALIHTPKVLFLDEPTNGVDPVSRRDFWRILYQLLREGVTIFVSTAYLDEAERCNRVGLIHQGRLLAVGTPHEVKTLMRGTILEVPRSERAKRRRRSCVPSCRLAPCRSSATAFTSPSTTPSGRPPPSRTHPREAAVTVTTIRASRAFARGRLRLRSVRQPRSDRRCLREQLTTPSSCRDLEKRFGAFVAVNRVSFEVATRRDLRLSRPQRRRQVHHHPHALRHPRPHRRHRHRRRLRRPHPARGDQGPHRLHEPEVLALRGPHRRGEHRLLQRHLPPRPRQEEARRKEWVIEMAGLAEHRHTRTGVLSAAGSSGSPSAAPSSTNRRSSSSTSPPPASTPSAAASSGT